MGGDSPHRFLFFDPDLDSGSDAVVLEGDEYRHLARALRVPVGETVFVTNGRGLIASCLVEEVDKRRARLRVSGVEEVRPSRSGVTLALACLKKDAFERAVEQCTELGIAEIVPFASSKAHLKAYSTGFLERLERIALSAVKQSFQPTIPEIRTVIPFEGVLEYVKKSSAALVGDPDGKHLESVAGQGTRLIVVGPEGGFSEAERDQLVGAGAELVSVSRFRLRAETAAAAIAAVVMSTRLD